MKLLRCIPLLLLALAPQRVYAGAWTRDQGQLYVNLNYSRIAARGFFQLDGQIVNFGSTYTQHQLAFYGEVGVISRWLTLQAEWQALRVATLDNPDPVDGFHAASTASGDLRLGAWSGLVVKPLRFSVGVLLGVPTGDPQVKASAAEEAGCQAGSTRACDAVFTARSLPSGDGEFDVELRAALGYGFGGFRRWPLQHYVLAEAGYWFRTVSRADPARRKLPDDFSYKLELGVKIPYRFIDRFWFVGRIGGIEALLSNASRDAPDSVCRSTAAFSGLGACVRYTAYGFDVAGRIYRGLSASIGVDSAFRAGLVAAGANARFALSYER